MQLRKLAKTHSTGRLSFSRSSSTAIRTESCLRQTACSEPLVIPTILSYAITSGVRLIANERPSFVFDALSFCHLFVALYCRLKQPIKTVECYQNKPADVYPHKCTESNRPEIKDKHQERPRQRIGEIIAGRKRRAGEEQTGQIDSPYGGPPPAGSGPDASPDQDGDHNS